MIAEGNIRKMDSEFATPVQYTLITGNTKTPLNTLIGKKIRFTHNGVINCIVCGKKTNKSFNQGFCYQCFQTAPQADLSVVNPEKSMAQFGISRDMEWSQQHDLIPHYVYLAITSGLKVGVTRHHQIPTRWIDQGAVKAVKIAETPNRHIAGIIETFLKKYYADKTNWRQMLKNEYDKSIDLIAEKNRIKTLLHPEFHQYLLNDSVFEIQYPGKFMLKKPVALTFDKEKTIEGKLTAIKGQYLIFDNENCMNIKKHSGYFVSFEKIE